MKERLFNFLPYLIFITSLGFSYFMWRSSSNIIEGRIQFRFNSYVRQVEGAIADRLATYADAQYAASGLFLGTNTIKRQDWREFVEAINLMERYPGINGVGYAIQVDKKDSAKFLADIKKEDPQGNFRIKSKNQVVGANNFFIIKYIEPIENNRPALGFDMGSEPRRREAMEAARDSGKPQLSSKVILVQDEQHGPGFLVYVPFYKNGDVPATVDEKRANFLGWIYSPFKARDFMQNILQYNLKEVSRYVDIAVYDGENVVDTNLLYSNISGTQYKTDNFNPLQISVYNRKWTLVAVPTGTFFKLHGSNLPRIVLLASLMLSVAFFVIAFLLVRTRRQAMLLAQNMTVELRHMNDELKEKNTELMRSNADLEQFAYVASHDLKEPLRMVSNYTQLLEHKYGNVLDEDGKTFIRYASEGAERMGNLINDLLEYARVGRGDTNIHFTNLNEILNTVIKYNEIKFKETGAQINVSKLPSLMVSENYILSLFHNLINNALKFRRKGVVPVINISALKDGTSWVFNVEDNGIGIDQSHIDKIFVIFQRLHSKEEYPGTGIGLAICKKIVEFHGGSIWAQSTPGKGTTISFTLPA